MNNQQRAQLKSVVSSVIALANSINGTEHPITDWELRSMVEGEVLALLDLVHPDPTSWPYVKDRFFYDIYLAVRAEAGTLTLLDETRGGLNAANFTDTMEWHRHSLRVAERKLDENTNKTKTCSSCGEDKSITKFKHRGGAVCNACRARKARERRRNEA